MADTTPSLIHEFTDDELQVADILANLKTLKPFYEPPNLVALTPSWPSKRLRSTLVSSTKSHPDRPKEDSGKGNSRNASPDSPLLLKSPPESCWVRGVSEPLRGKKGTKKQGSCKKDDDGDGDGDVDDPVGVIRSKKKLKNEAMGGKDGKGEVPESDSPYQIDVTWNLGVLPRRGLPIFQLALANVDRDPDLTIEASPQGSARTSFTSSCGYSPPSFPFDLNLLPGSTDTQLIPPHEKNRRPGQPQCGCLATYDGSWQAETAKAARKRRLEIYRMKNGKSGASKAHPLSRQ